MKTIKSLVLTITPNPSLDITGTVDHIIPNEKCYVLNEKKYPGGNAINVSRVLTRLNINNTATGFLGGSIGNEIHQLLHNEHVKSEFVQISESSRVGLTISNRSDHQQTRLSFAGPRIKTFEKKLLLNKVSSYQKIQLIVIGGSLPPNYKNTDICKIIEEAHKKNIPVIVDCPGHTLRKIIRVRPLLIKPNLEEFQALTKTSVKTIKSVSQQAKKLLSKVSLICISSVESGALLVTPTQTYFGRIPKMKIKSTVGAGDSMVAAMSAEVFKNNTHYGDVLRWGLAAAAATLAHSGTTLGSANEIKKMYKKIKIELVD